MMLKFKLLISIILFSFCISISTKSLEKLSFDRLFPESKFELIYKKAINLYSLLYSNAEFKNIDKQIFNELLDIYGYTLPNQFICECCKIQNEDKVIIYRVMQHNFETFNAKFKNTFSDKIEYINFIFHKLLQNVVYNI